MNPTRVLFVCVHNAGRSQMAEGFLNALARERVVNAQATSAGTLGAGKINPMAAEAMSEVGIPLDSHFPKVLTQAMADEADRVISMGCGVDVAACPARFLLTEDWGLDDPAGQPIERVREIRDEIRRKVEALLEQLIGQEA